MTGMKNLSAPGYRQFGDESKHTHPDTSALTFGCSGCIERVQRDQKTSAWRDAPYRRCTWRFNLTDRYGERGEWLSFTLDVRVPQGAEGWEVDEWYAGDTGEAIERACKKAGIDDDEAIFKACHTIKCSIGPIVSAPEQPVVDEPTLF